MATTREKAECVSWFIETKSDLQTRRNFRTKYARDPPSRPYRGMLNEAERNLNIFVSFCNNFHLSVFF